MTIMDANTIVELWFRARDSLLNRLKESTMSREKFVSDNTAIINTQGLRAAIKEYWSNDLYSITLEYKGRTVRIPYKNKNERDATFYKLCAAVNE